MVELVPDHDEPALKPFPEHASYSSLRLWLTCQQKWLRTRLMPTPARQSGYALVGGSAVHLVTERYEAEYCLIEAAAA